MSYATDETRGISEAEIRAMPTFPIGDLDVPPPPLLRAGEQLCEGDCGGIARPDVNGHPRRFCSECDRHQAPKRYRKDDERLIGSLLDQWVGYTGAKLFQLTPDTEPEAIAATQRGVVGRFLANNRRATPEQISEGVCLPVWNVKRRLKELKQSRKRATA